LRDQGGPYGELVPQDSDARFKNVV
jgi:hypothetical protein